MKKRFAIKLIKECTMCKNSVLLCYGGGQDYALGAWKCFYCKECDMYVLGAASPNDQNINNHETNFHIRTCDYFQNCGFSSIAAPKVQIRFFLSCAHDIENRTILLQNHHHLHHVVYPRQIQREKARNIENSWNNFHYVFSVAFASFFVVSYMCMLSNK
jgi:hypothetical protein